MSYKYKIVGYPEYEEDLRGIFGVDETVLPKETIDRLPNLPAAELQVVDTTPGYGTLTGDALHKLRLAVLYLGAANCLQIVKINVLKEESDNKTTGIRFTDTFKLTEADLRARAAKYVSDVHTELGIGVTKELFEAVRPTVDVITGSPYA